MTTSRVRKAVVAVARNEPLERMRQLLKKHGCKCVGDDWTCPSHDDGSPSLTVKAGNKQLLVIKCGAGCETDDVLKALGTSWDELRGDKLEVVGRREHAYSDKRGTVLYRAVIRSYSDGSKRVKMQRLDPSGDWVTGIEGIPRVLYGLAGLRAAIKKGYTVHLTEGEKDADALNTYFKDHDLPEFATCSGAASTWSNRESAVRYLKSLRGVTQMILWADNDVTGYKDALTRFAEVNGAGLPAIIRLPLPTAPKADVFDHLAEGHKPEDGVVVTEATLRDLVGKAGDGEHEKAVSAELERWRVRDEAKRLFQSELIEQRQAKSAKARRMSGAEFFLDLPDMPPVIWGDGNRILWIDGEPLMICGDDGTGKSTIDHQLLAARLGIRDDLLDYSVEPAKGVVAYLAMDRPEQARRAGHRLFPEDIEVDFRSQLERLAVWRGPLPFDPLGSPDALADWLQSEFGHVSDVHADSLKDMASNLSEDGVGSRLNSAIQEVISRGINWVGLHHQRKASGENKKPDSLADVYGSRWLTAGHGSVLMLTRERDDKDVVELSQLKEPADRVPRMLLRHDRSRGSTRPITASRTVEQVLDEKGESGATIAEVASAVYGKSSTDLENGERKRVGRQLGAMVENGSAKKVDGSKGGSGGSKAARYVLLEGAQE